MTTENNMVVAVLAQVIQQANIDFEKMSPAEKRVQIARDVISQLEAKKFIANFNLWFKAPAHTDKCTGCALGGMFMCLVGRTKEVIDNSYYSSPSGYDVLYYLRKYFEESQLHLIEHVYESGKGSRYTQVEENLFELAVNYFPDVTTWTPDLRMRVIMLNIIKNNGDFILEDAPATYLYISPPTLEKL